MRGTPPIEDRLRAAGLPPLPRTAWVEVDLDRIASNLRAVAAALPPGVTIEAVVKADAYGHGAPGVSAALLAAGATGLAVATLDEALELRAAGIDAPLMVLFQIPPDGVVDAARSRVAIAAGDRTLFDRGLAAYARAAGDDPTGLGPLAVEICLETGLGRDGLFAAEAVAAARAIAAQPGARLAGVWTHLQAPDDPATTARQLERFAAGVAALAAAGVPVPRRHVLASGGVFAEAPLARGDGAGRAPAYDGVRVGLALYGFVPDGQTAAAGAAATAAALRPALSIHARPVRVAELDPGEGVSYGPAFVTTRPSRIATLPIGYADGWPRGLSDRAEALVRGLRVPLVGRVAMDALMADVTDVAGPPVTPDDEFVLLGEQDGAAIPAGELARARTTITHEVIATLSRRLTRVYTASAAAVGVRTLTQDQGSWQISRSGTATSAISRSMRS